MSLSAPPPQQQLHFADAILEAAGGCPQLRRTVFQFLDRFEALRLVDVSTPWRETASHPASWLPQLIGYQYTQSTRSVTLSTNGSHHHGEGGSAASPSSRSPSRRKPSPGGGSPNNSFSSNPLQQQQQQQQQQQRSPTNNRTRSPQKQQQQHVPSLLSQLAPARPDRQQQQQKKRGGGGGTTAHANSNNNNGYDDDDDDGSGAAYVAPTHGADAGHGGIFAPQGRQLVARSCFGPSVLFNGQPIPSDILEQLWDLSQPEMYFLVSECFRKTPRELAMALEHCEKLCGLAGAAAASGVNVNSAMLNVQSQLFLTVELICHPVMEKRADRRFTSFFPCAHILLRCAALIRASCLEWRVPSSLTNALLVPQYFQTPSSTSSSSAAGGNHQQEPTKVTGKNLSPVVILISEICRWHDMEPVREHAPWFAAIASWAAVAPTLWTELALHPVMLLPHVLTLKALALPLPAFAQPSSPSNNNNTSGGNSSGGGIDNFAGGGGATAIASIQFADPAALNSSDEEARELAVLRGLLRKHLDSTQCVKTVVHSAIEIAVHHHRKQQGMTLALPRSATAPKISSAEVAETNVKNVSLCFHVLAKMEILLKKVNWDGLLFDEGPAAAVGDLHQHRNRSNVIAEIPDGYIESQVELSFSQFGSGQVGINLLYDARGRLGERSS